MIGLRNKIATAVLAAAVVLTGFVPSQAIQMPAAPQVEKTSAVENVQYYRDYYRPYRRDYYRPGYRPGAYYRPGWYGGYRGYSYYRPGYRRYNGYWYPLAAFAPARSLLLRATPRPRRAWVRLTSPGARTATGPTAPTTTPSSLITARASSAIRLIDRS